MCSPFDMDDDVFHRAIHVWSDDDEDQDDAPVFFDRSNTTTQTTATFPESAVTRAREIVEITDEPNEDGGNAGAGRYRSWCFTIQDPTPEVEARVKQTECRYLVVGREIAPTTNRPHLQGLVVFDNPVRRKTVQDRLGSPNCHVEIVYSTVDACEKYCKKDGDFFEKGVKPVPVQERVKAAGDANKRKYEQAYNLAREERYDEIPKDMLIRHYQSLHAIGREMTVKPKPIAQDAGIWVHGLSGSGKSTYVLFKTQGKSVYLKNLTKWWDHYKGEDDVIVDDIDPASAKAILSDLKQWLGRTVCKVEGKGYTVGVDIRPKRVWVTSQYSVDECFPKDAKTAAAITRRCQVINFDDPVTRDRCREEAAEFNANFGL